MDQQIKVKEAEELVQVFSWKEWLQYYMYPG